MKEDRCPLCKRGIILEWKAGWYCSRIMTYRRNPCIFEVGDSDSPAQYQQQLTPLKKRWEELRKQRSKLRKEKSR